MKQPLAIDLFCGLGGWTDGLLAEGWRVVGFDIERHVYGNHRYPAQLVIQDVVTLDGAQFRNADLIVASPPCQEFSYMAMPWNRAKQIRRALRGEGDFPEGYTGSRTITDLTRLFDACFRIQREACAAAGRHIPMVVENVRGAQEWVGRAKWNYGSFFLWGDVPALMPPTLCAGVKVPGMDWNGHPNGSKPVKADYKAVAFNSPKHSGRSPAPGNGTRFTSRDCGVEADEGRKGAGAGAEWLDQNLCQLPSSSPRRKAASALIAKIPETLSRHIARTFKPGNTMEAAAS